MFSFFLDTLNTFLSKWFNAEIRYMPNTNEKFMNNQTLIMRHTLSKTLSQNEVDWKSYIVIFLWHDTSRYPNNDNYYSSSPYNSKWSIFTIIWSKIYEMQLE
jgi:hypothetical protein